jgi:hypothetical protein
MVRPPPLLLRLGLALAAATGSVNAAENRGAIWTRDRLVAWCIVPYDAAKRDAPARAAMLQRLGLHRLAYDWRAEHVPYFDAEVAAMRRAGIELTAWWFPARLDPTAERILECIARHGIRPQLWVTGGGAPAGSPAEQDARIENELARLRPIVAAAARLGCQVGLYNHGGWFGRPENQLALLARLDAEGARHVGLVYNFHHGHDDIDRFAEIWSRIRARTLAVNLNGMKSGGDRNGEKILYLGEGDRELDLLRVIAASGWIGDVGILNHRTNVDAEVGLAANLAGLEQLRLRLRTSP